MHTDEQTQLEEPSLDDLREKVLRDEEVTPEAYSRLIASLSAKKTAGTLSRGKKKTKAQEATDLLGEDLSSFFADGLTGPVKKTKDDD